MRILGNTTPGELKAAQSESTTGTAILISTPIKLFGWLVESGGTRVINFFDGSLSNRKWLLGNPASGERVRACTPAFLVFDTSLGIDSGPGVGNDVSYTVFYQDL